MRDNRGIRGRKTASGFLALTLLAAACSGTSTDTRVPSEGPPPSSTAGSPTSTASSPAMVQTRALSPVFSIDVPDPADIELAFGSIWTGNHHENSVTRIDPDTGEVIATVTNAGYQVLALVEADGALWAGSAFDGMVRIDPGANEVVARVRGQFGDLALGFGSLWATTFNHKVRRIDSTTGAVIETIAVGSGRTDERSWITIDDAQQAVWVGVGDGTTVYRIDPRTNEIVATLDQTGDDPRVVTAGGSVWILSNVDGELQRVDTDVNLPVEGSEIELSKADFCAPRSAPSGKIWFACSDGLLYQFDAVSGYVLAVFDLSEGRGFGAAGGIGFDGSFVWTASTLGQTVRAFELPYAPNADPA
jgi:streptogramin lyase